MKRIALVLIVYLGYAFHLTAQVPDSTPPPAGNKSPAPASQSGGQSSSQPAPPLFGKDLPFFSPATEIMEWDGKHWNINNQRLFQARFEKYLNATEETTDDDKRYQQIIHDILQKLAPADMNVSGSFATSNGMLDKKLDGTYEQKVAPAKLTAQGVADAWRLLPQASAYPIDANLCDALSVTVYGVWQSQHAQYQLAQATEELKRQREQQHARLQATAADIAHITPAPSRSGAREMPRRRPNQSPTMRVSPPMSRGLPRPKPVYLPPT
jgi:hypothetical protein